MLQKIFKTFNLWAPPIVWAYFIFLFSSMTITPVSGVYWKEFVVKKSAHLIEYGVLAGLLYRALVGSKISRLNSVLLAILISIVYAVTDELHQSFTPGRESTIRDVFVDTIGATLSVYLIDKKRYT